MDESVSQQENTILSCLCFKKITKSKQSKPRWTPDPHTASTGPRCPPASQLPQDAGPSSCPHTPSCLGGGAAAPQPPRHGVLLPRLWGLSMDVLGPWAPPEAPGPPTPVWPERGTAGVNASLLLGYDWPGPYGVGGGRCWCLVLSTKNLRVGNVCEVTQPDKRGGAVSPRRVSGTHSQLRPHAAAPGDQGQRPLCAGGSEAAQEAPRPPHPFPAGEATQRPCRPRAADPPPACTPLRPESGFAPRLCVVRAARPLSAQKTWCAWF